MNETISNLINKRSIRSYKQDMRDFKLDPARTINNHTAWEYYNGRTDNGMHNLNQVLVQKHLEEMAREHMGKRIWHHYTSGWAGAPHWGASTSGDNGTFLIPLGSHSITDKIKIVKKPVYSNPLVRKRRRPRCTIPLSSERVTSGVIEMTYLG